MKLVLIITLILCKNLCTAQDSTKLNKAIALPDKFFSFLDKKASSVEQKLNKQTIRYLSKLQKQENKLRKKMWKKDSTMAKQLFSDANEKYSQLKNATGDAGKYSSVYSGHLDSLSTALQFLKNQNLASDPQLQKTLDQYKSLQSKLNATDQAKKYFSQRQKDLKEQFEKLGMIKELRQYRKQVYYYQVQVNEYKKSFEDPSKMEAKLMELAMKLPKFKSFFAKHSMLGSLFALPGNDDGSTASIKGLQTRTMINQGMTERFGSGADITQQLQQNVQSAQGELSQLKNKLSGLQSGNYGNSGSDVEMPEGFKPNEQKAKSFLKRLEYGSNVQSQRASYYFPVTSDIGLSLGYKLNDESVIGIGAAYKLGWGNGWKDIKITHQGVGLRSFIDWKIKGSFYISGGYEQNYRSMFQSIDQLKDYSAWQASGLIGLSKKYSLNKKMKGELKLLWDFLSYQQVPRPQPVLFRIGYNIK